MRLCLDSNDQEKSLPLVAVAGSGPVLLGRNWLPHLQLNWKELGINDVHPSSPVESLESIWKRYESTVFGVGLGFVKPFKAMLLVKPASSTNPDLYLLLSGRLLDQS